MLEQSRYISYQEQTENILKRTDWKKRVSKRILMSFEQSQLKKTYPIPYETGEMFIENRVKSFIINVCIKYTILKDKSITFTKPEIEVRGFSLPDLTDDQNKCIFDIIMKKEYHNQFFSFNIHNYFYLMTKE